MLTSVAGPSGHFEEETRELEIEIDPSNARLVRGGDFGAEHGDCGVEDDVLGP
ncbi:hypothetical protein ACYOEI_09655 [Singulisphaera rosea]